MTTARVVVLTAPGGPDALEIVERPRPVPGTGEVCVRADAIGLGRPDVMMRTGKYKWMPSLPGVIGNELVGTVDAIGSGVDPMLLGKPVLISARELETRGGCYADHMVVPSDALLVLPDGLDPAQAVSLPNYQLAWGLLHDATRGGLPRSIYLNGAGGGVGSALIQLAVQLGIEVVAGAGNEVKRRAALMQGATASVDTGLPPDHLVQAVRDARGARGVDLVLDHLCGPHVSAHLDMLERFGLLVSYNALAGAAGDDVFAALRAKAPLALGIRAYNMHAYNGAAMRDARRALLATPTQWLAEGRLRPLIDDRIPLTEVVRAHERLDRRDVIGKLVLVP